MITIGVIGYGYWGPNLVRNFSETPGLKVACVSDLRAERLERVTARYPTVQTTVNHAELIKNPAIDVVAIATPVFSHFDLAMQALKAGKHVFVEKPLTMSYEQSVRLIDEAEKRNLVLMVDHTFVYTGGVRAIKKMVENNEMGELYYYDSVRVNLGLFQRDVDVIWDLAVHDLSIMDYIFDFKPVAISATGARHVPGQLDNIAFLTLFYESSFIAHIHVNWLAPIKLRKTLISGNQKMIVFDDLEPSEKVKVYDKGISLNNSDAKYKDMSINYRTGDMLSPKLDMTEALTIEANHLVDCITNSKRPLTDGHMGARVVKVMEAASKSLAEKGKLINLDLN